MRVAYLIAVALLLPYGGSHAAELYKWTDEQGRTHYSDKPPPGKETESRAVKPVADSEPLPAQSKENEEQCAKLLENKRVLESFEKVEADLDGDGVAEELNEAQKKAQLQRAENLIERQCKKVPPTATAANKPTEEKAESGTGEQIAQDRDYFADDQE